MVRRPKHFTLFVDLCIEIYGEFRFCWESATGSGGPRRAIAIVVASLAGFSQPWPQLLRSILPPPRRSSRSLRLPRPAGSAASEARPMPLAFSVWAVKEVDVQARGGRRSALWQSPHTRWRRFTVLLVLSENQCLFSTRS